MEGTLLIIFGLLVLIFLLVMVGNRIRISQPIILVIGGLLISLIPGIPAIAVGPDLIFTIFLPPLLFDAAWYTSISDFKKNSRQIVMLAFGLVFFTSFIVAYVSSSMIPGFTMALGFLLGGIISPPDAVAATSVLRNISMPKKIIAVLEGESLLNDASSLIVVRFAIMAVLSGTFSMQSAVGDFFLVVFAGAGIGLLIAFLISLLLKVLPTTPEIDTCMSLMAPYIMYLAAEHFHYSGVLAVVFGGLFLSFRSHAIFTHTSRFQSSNVWESFIFILNGLVFILIGLQLPLIVKNFNETTLLQAIGYGVVIAIVAIAVRMVWIFASMLIANRLRKTPIVFSALAREAFVLGWSGMRGVVSLAAALNIPLFLPQGEAFPYRNLILFITFVVILFTLLLHGFTLPWVVKKLQLEDLEEVIPEEDQKESINMRLTNLAIAILDQDYGKELEANPYLQRLKTMMERRLDASIHQLTLQQVNIQNKRQRDRFKEVYRNILELQREELVTMRRDNVFLDEKIREAQESIDFEEIRIGML